MERLYSLPPAFFFSLIVGVIIGLAGNCLTNKMRYSVVGLIILRLVLYIIMGTSLWYFIAGAEPVNWISLGTGAAASVMASGKHRDYDNKAR